MRSRFRIGRWTFGWGLALACALALLPPARVEARKQREVAYRFEQVWNAALRLIRVDLRFPVTDRDQEGGFVLFEYVEHEKRHPGSIELVAQAKSARPATVVIVQVQGMPSYVEQMIVDRLEKKLQAELGVAPPPPKPPAPPPAEPDAGTPAEPGP